MSKEIIISDHGGEPVASSLEVAKNFDKQHKNVVRDIEKLKRGLLKFEHTPLMFFETTYIQTQNNQTYKCYEMTKDGFKIKKVLTSKTKCVIIGYRGQEVQFLPPNT